MRDLDARMMRAYGNRLRSAGAALEGYARILDSLSYRSVLARGFALVRGVDGTLRRRASSVVPGETLTLTFADGEGKAMEKGKVPSTLRRAVRQAEARAGARCS